MTPPLVVLNNFTQATASHTKLMRVTFQHMFPTINIKTVRLSECRRVVLFHLAEDGNVEMRHYAVRANPVGVSKSVKRIIEAKIPDLGTLEVGGHSFFLLLPHQLIEIRGATGHQ
jgi:ribosome biogenesis protein SSF1/2